MTQQITSQQLDFTKNSDSLIPVVIQDATTLKVLMLGYMNREAYDKSMTEGVVTFFSRTKQRLWTKGESSGNFLNIVSTFIDCDNDTLLIQVNPIGPTCHRGTTSCFDTDGSEGFIRSLNKLIVDRHTTMPENSYTTSLFTKGINKISQKVGEEAVETVIEAIANNRERLIYESSDLIFHLLVLLAAKEIDLSEIEKELLCRHK